MIAGRECNDSTLALPGTELQEPVRRSSQLERASGLQALAFQPDARAVDSGLDQRRLLDLAGNALGRLDDGLPAKLDTFY
jgi:hypothetical protein